MAHSERPLDHLPYAHGGPAGRALFRVRPGDFLVEEQMRVPEHPTGAHWWLKLAKRSVNTRDVARVLSSLGSARLREIGYAGLKDRHAEARQWFSIPIAALDPEKLPEQLPPELHLLDCKRARHAIRRGGLLGNRFEIRLREVSGDRDALRQRLDAVNSGVPNYFGEQRFGRGGGNVAKARAWLRDTTQAVPRHERGLYLSAARSWLFNKALGARVDDGTWNTIVPGEAVLLDGKRSWFPAPSEPDELHGRLALGDIHPSGPLVGAGEPIASGPCLALEQTVLGGEIDLVNGLIALGMKAERRALRVLPRHWNWHWEKDDLRLAFELPRGCYATSLLREVLITVVETSRS